MYRLTTLLLALSLLLSACASAAGDGSSGISGLITMGPMCPVIREGEPCPDKAIEAEVEVLAASGRKVTTFHSDKDGRFRVPLKPGEYLLRPRGNGPQRAPEQQVTVPEGAFATVDIHYDSGIR